MIQRRSLSLVVAFVLALVLGLTLLAPMASPAHAAGTGRECSDEATTVTDRQYVCINGSDDVPVRGYVDNNCFRQVDPVARPAGSLKATFTTVTCAKPGSTLVQGEKIAQARFIMWLDKQNRRNFGENPDSDAVYVPIHPGVQWEITQRDAPHLRGDVLNYQPDYSGRTAPSTNPMGMYELKTSVSFDSYTEAAELVSLQAQAYAEILQYDNPVLGSSPRKSLWASLAAQPSQGYTDNFTVQKRTCESRDARGRAVKSAIDHVFDVKDTPGHDGALIAERTVKEYKCEEGKRKDEVSKEEKAYEAYKWWRVGLPGKDVEGFEDEFNLVPQAYCAKISVTCSPSPQTDEVEKQEQVVTRVGFLRTDATGSAYWQENGSPFCAAIENIERSRGAATPVLADRCSDAASLSAALDDADIAALLKSLDSVTLRGVMESVWKWIGRGGGANVSSPARVTGDPHLVTLDGLNYDMQSVGEFDLLSVPDRDIVIQSRFAAAGTQSSVVALATNWGGTKVELHADGTILANGRAITLEPGKGFTPSEEAEGYLFNDEGTYRLSWGTGVEGDAPVVMSWQPINAALGGFGVQVPPGVTTAGLLGDNNGIALDDIETRDGDPVDATDATAIHDAYADSWRIRDATSLFTYGAGTTTATFTDRSFPRELVTTGDFPVTEQVTAQQACEAAGITAGPAFRNCVLDVLVTRDASFANAFVGAQDAVRSADDKVMTAGRLQEDFAEASIAPNLAPLRTGDLPGFGNVAGPLTGAEQYRLHVPDMPNHDQVTVSFDLLAIGQWDTADAVAIRIDNRPAETLDMTGATLSALPSGDPVRVKRVTMPVDHYKALISIALAGAGLEGTQRFAIDNVEVAARVVAPQAFRLTLEPGVAMPLRTPQLPAGSGSLETWGARDNYTVSVNHQDLLLDWQTRSDSVKWALVDANGKTVEGGVTSAGNSRLRDLSGSYTLSVESAGDAPPTTEAYSLDLLVTPEAQQFSFELPGPVRLPADLPSPAVANGAGALETKLSSDVYSFSVTTNDRAITVNPVVCPYQNYRQRLAWTVLDSQGTSVGSGACWSQTISGLAPGDYKLRVEAEREATGKYEIVVQQEGAAAVFTEQPAEASNQRTQNFAFNSDTAGATFECALDAPSYVGPFSACASPKSYDNLADGTHTFQVRTKTADGSRGPATTHTVEVDTALPNVQITRKPPVQSNTNGPVLEYSAEKRGMTYQCSLVPVGSATDFATCYGSSVYRNLAHGTYRFTVVGTDWVGNKTTVSYDFMVDLEPPVVTLTPASNLTSTASPQFTFTANETATYECSLVPVAQPDTFSPCASPKQYSGLTDGTQYRFLVKATDVAGQWAARGVTWTPYATPPSVTITSKPAGSSTNAAPAFAFTSNMANPTFECSLELSAQASAFTPCSSPKTYSGKAAGTYKFVVKATDASGSWVSSSYQFVITAPSGDTQAPTTPGTASAVISPAAATLGADTDSPAAGIPVRISWSASSDNVGVAGYQLQYSTNGGAFTVAGNVTGTSVTLNVPAGTSTWRYQVRAYDTAGNFSTASTASTAITLGLDQETVTSRVSFAGTWTTASAGASSGGATKYATASSASATYKPATGTNQIAVVMATGPAAGRATIAIDGGTATTIDLYSSTPGVRSIMFSSATLSATASHTVVVKPLGTKNSASSGTRVDIDGFLTRK